MNLLYYPPGVDRYGERLKRAMERLGPAREVEVCRSPEDLEACLRKPCSGRTVAVLVAAIDADLWQLGALVPLFEGVQILLILADRKEETIRLAHRLRPRFLGYMDQGIEGVVDVLARIWEGAKPGWQGASPSRPEGRGFAGTGTRRRPNRGGDQGPRIRAQRGSRGSRAVRAGRR